MRPIDRKPNASSLTADPRVTFLITALGDGGAQTQMVRLAVQLKARGWQVQAISMLPPERFLQELGSAGIPVASLGMRRGVPSPQALARTVVLLREWKPDALTCFLYHAHLLGTIAGRMARVPVITGSIRNEYFGGRRHDRILRVVNRFCDMVTTNSQLVADSLTRRGLVAAGDLRIIPNAVARNSVHLDPAGRAVLRHELGVGERDFLWLAAGRLEAGKDYPNLLDAFHRVVQRHPGAQLRLAGEGLLRAELMQRAADLGIAQSFTFLGFRRDIAALYGAADGFVLSSAWEGMPNVVMEALGAGTPVVATDVGGVAELVEEGRSGLIVPPRDPGALAAAMERLMSLPEEERRRMGQCGRAYVQANHELEGIVDTWEGLYRELLKGKGRLAKWRTPS